MRIDVAKNKIKSNGVGRITLILFSLYASYSHAEESKINLRSVKDNVQRLFTPESSQDFRKVQLNQLSKFEFDASQVQDLPLVSARSQALTAESSYIPSKKLNLFEAVQLAVSRHPDISQTISALASQNANIDVARAGYYPQLSAGVSTGDFTSGSQRGQQLLNLNATQMLYDFGKTKSGVNTQQAKLMASQAEVLVAIDQIALEVASAIVNIKRYQEISRIAREQIKGISRIAEIANLRAKAGISSQADPIQAQSYLEAAQSNLIVQETQLNLYRQRLKTLLGSDVSNLDWEVPESLVARSNIYSDPQFNQIPQMMLAKAQVDVAASEKKQTSLTRYPTLNVKGTLSQAVNGTNPNNNKDNGTDSSIMLEATSNFYQGGAIASQTRAASYAEEAAKAKVNAVYLDTMNSIRLAQEQVENKQRQMQVLVAQQATTVRTKELYQEQYKLGTRTAVDLLNAEQAIHSANSQIETARYDIYDNLVQYIAAAGKTRDVYQLNNLTIQGVEIQP
ncbi:TolC family protein [Acinetobacter lanii]|uniref:TolC family protein n=1 Tax=Acinetobacter lanii TaxID=2715163 RepID=A0A6G8S503_9GAMM|nr:TolC family protein [Acinetobacter lanii]QIO09235.1 TolC family protein [Acinetobacter lanii]